MTNKKVLFLIITILLCFNIGIASIKADEEISLGNPYTNYETSDKLYCGGSAKKASIENIPKMFPRIVSIVYYVLEIAVPILLIIFGIIDLIKAITAGKEDEIKKNQITFIRRLITALLAFFIFAVVKLMINLAADNDKDNILDCVNCFINYKTNQKGKCGT